MNNKVTVLMPVYNGEKYLPEAIESVLDQTFKDFEFLIIDDASTDNSAKIIKSYNDKRIRFIQHAKNQGLSNTLNEGVSITEAEYIVRMDQDDISLPERIQKLVSFMDKKQDISICGSSRIIIGNRDGFVINYESNPDKIKPLLLFECCLAHPTVILRKEDLIKHDLNYQNGLKTAEDYDLWARASRYLNYTNLDAPLLKYREHETQLSAKEDILKAENIRIWEFQLESFGIKPSIVEIDTHEKIAFHKTETNKEFVDNVFLWFEKLTDQNNKTAYYSAIELENILADYWYKICKHNQFHGIYIWNKFIKLKISKSKNIKFSQKMSLLYNCLRFETKKGRKWLKKKLQLS